MKRIFLVRHAEPMRMEGVTNEAWPLSTGGRERAERVLAAPMFSSVQQVHASPYRRALETAQCVGLPVHTDERLHERLTGNATLDMGDCWLRQYEEPDFKCPGGESFVEVGRRMAACIGDVLAGLDDGTSALIVSHAAAICAFLKRHCSIVVTDRASKTRKITWQNREIYTGNLTYLTCFCLTYQQEKLLIIEAVK